MIDSIIGSEGGQYPTSPFDTDNPNIEGTVNSAGDSVLFNPIQGSGNLNNWRGNLDTTIVFPPDMHTDPQYGHVIHFDIYHKNQKRN